MMLGRSRARFAKAVTTVQGFQTTRRSTEQSSVHAGITAQLVFLFRLLVWLEVLRAMKASNIVIPVLQGIHATVLPLVCRLLVPLDFFVQRIILSPLNVQSEVLAMLQVYLRYLDALLALLAIIAPHQHQQSQLVLATLVFSANPVHFRKLE